MRQHRATRIRWIPRRRPRASVGLGDVGQEDELAEREELGLPNRGESDLRGSDRFPGLMPANEMAETALDDMDELKPPPDPAR